MRLILRYFSSFSRSRRRFPFLLTIILLFAAALVFYRLNDYKKVYLNGRHSSPPLSPQTTKALIVQTNLLTNNR